MTVPARLMSIVPYDVAAKGGFKDTDKTATARNTSGRIKAEYQATGPPQS